MKATLLFALLLAPLAQAFPVRALPAQVILGQAGSDEDEDDEAPAPAEAPKSDAPSAAPAAETAAPAGDATQPTQAGSAESQKLVSGAPLYNPNVAVHIVERKAFSDKGKSELVLYPIWAQVNGKFTQHYGTAGSYVYHLHENFGLQLTGLYDWYSSESAWNAELTEKVRQTARAATSLLLVWGVQGGVEVTPFYGKFAWYENSLGHFSLVLNGGAGVGSTRILLKPTNAAGPATFGDTGMKFMGSLGIGARLQLGDRWAFRLELRDMVYTARVDSVNGCTLDDLTALQQANQRTPGASLSGVPVSGACRSQNFDGVQPGTEGRNLRDDLPLAIQLVRDASSDVLNNVGLYAGIAFLF